MPIAPRDFTRNVRDIVADVVADVEAFLGVEPTPVTFTQQPTVDPLTGTAGEVTFTATPGVLSDGSAPTRAWLLGSTTLATTPSYAPPSSVTGNVVYQEYGPDGAVSDPITLTVNAPSGGGTPTPTPVFTTQPSISPSNGTVGTTTYTANDGSASNADSYTRRWLLNGDQISVDPTVIPQSAGTLALEVTATGAGGSALATSATANVALAGFPETSQPYTIMMIGSSTPEFYFIDGVAPTNPNVTMSTSGTSWSPVTGVGAGTLGDVLQRGMNRPIRLIDRGARGTKQTQWMGTSSALISAANAAVNAGGVDLVIDIVGFNDAKDGPLPDPATHAANKRNAHAYLRSRLGANLKIAIGFAQKFNGSANTDVQLRFTDLYLAEADVVNDANTFFYTHAYDQPQDSGGIHQQVPDGYITHATRGATNIMRYLLGQQVHRGPFVSSLTSESTTSTVVNLIHSTGTDISDVGTINNTWRVAGNSNFTGSVTPTAIEKVSPTAIRLTHAAITSGTVYVRALWGSYPPVTALYDNVGAPLNPRPVALGVNVGTSTPAST